MKTKRTAKFHKYLTLKQIKHLKDMNMSIRKLPEFVSSMFQKAEKQGNHYDTCWDCVEIHNRIYKRHLIHKDNLYKYPNGEVA